MPPQQGMDATSVYLHDRQAFLVFPHDPAALLLKEKVKSTAATAFVKDSKAAQSNVAARQCNMFQRFLYKDA